ncbi:ATP phosphoribosyltransferase [Methanocalculus sp.]|uniref:ATP phosphoribosyltransferase n=1 Tax=Methanocalculus sp. TaxID=2004547 RepID=UPI002715A3B9|nr:ATP phosphoribosyltransferase [Methanocalculus sp.]MDO8840964.1 ATP phosphoribosyltransferase [Methanocalculus sp.]
MNSRPSDLLRLAIPNKGRIAEPISNLIEKSGIHIINGGDRQLIAKTVDPHIEILYVRPIDIPEYVAQGVADLGITGLDMVAERGSDVVELLDLRLGRARLVVAVPEDSEYSDLRDLSGKKIATEFPGITRSFFGDRGIDVSVVSVSGACEAAPHLGIADAIVDLTSSGTTLSTNHLVILADVFSSSTWLIANRSSSTLHKEKIDEITLALDSVIRAKGQCYLMMNVRRECLDEIRSMLPGLSGPTVMDVASEQNLVAVHAVVAEERVYQLINTVKRAGAKDILVMDVQRMIP